MKYIALSIFLFQSIFGPNDANSIVLTHRLRHKNRSYMPIQDDAALLFDEEETKESPAPKK